MARLGEPLLSRVVVWKQLHLNQWFETTPHKRWRAIEGDVCKPEDHCSGCEVLTAVTMKSAVFCAVPPRSSETSQRFRGIHRVPLHSKM
jgi:hypothetical protein